MTSTDTAQSPEARRTERMGAAFRRHSLVTRILALFALGVALVAVTIYAFPRTEDGSYEREVVASAVGAVVTILGAGAVATITLWRQIRQRRESTILARFDDATWGRRAIAVGRMKIPDIVVVSSGALGRPWTDNVTCTFTEGTPRPEHSDLPEIRAERLPRLVQHAQERGITITDDPCVDLVDARIRLDRDESGRRRRVYDLEVAEATYFDFLATTSDLDSPVWAGDETTLRQHWAAYPTGIEDVGGLPGIAKIGVGTSVITADNQLVLGIRGRTIIAGQGGDPRKAVHIVAEGMVPGDLDRQGRISPAVTSLRGVAEELGVSGEIGSYGRVLTHTATGFFFDQERWQPCFAYTAHIDLNWDELQTASATASDYWEVESLIGMPFSIHDAGLRHLLTGTHPDLVLASNHAGAVLWFTLLNRHGFTVMRDELTGPGAVYRPARAAGDRRAQVTSPTA